VPDGKICFKCPEFFGSYNPYDKNGVDFWYCTAGQEAAKTVKVSGNSRLPRHCPNMFAHAKSDLRAGKNLLELRDEEIHES
jgi:lipopolysaccharide biosynthesis protein